MLLATVLSGLTLPFLWVSPTAPDLAVLIAMGLLGGIGQLLIVAAFFRAPASAVAPWNYSAMVWAALFGWTFWGEMPDEPVLLGAAIVIGSGLYLAHRETRFRTSRDMHRRPSADSGR
jgi:drug/metabolite transporter (DMT)-like permease